MASAAQAEATLKVYDGARLVVTWELPRVAEIGRREPSEPMPYARIQRPTGDRLIIADLHETNISRKHLTVEPRPSGKVSLGNDSSKNSIALAGGERLRPGERRVLGLPVVCEIGGKVLRIEPIAQERVQMQSLREPTLMPGKSLPPASTLLRGLVDESTGGEEASSVGNEDILTWLQASMEVFQSAATSAQFLPKAAEAAVQMVGLDQAGVLLYRDGKWSVAAIGTRDGPTNSGRWSASQSMLQKVLEERRTFYQVPQDVSAAQSLIGVQSLVAAPILDREGEVIGALYGERRSASAMLSPIRELEAKLFELLAYGVASGLARIEQEQQLIAERVRFEQFFTPELARMLESRGDDMLAARDVEITVLFCDIKGFSRISAKSGAAVAIEWVREVLSDMSDCVAEFQGVLVDYSGDALEAIWGAPLASEDHAAQACRAALKMREVLPALSHRWEAKLGEATDVSIGINTGSARVGNIGSRRKFKYGAFGTTVNLASRVQGATKHVGMPLLVTGGTVARLPAGFHLRRLCTVRTVNILEPVDLYELCYMPDEFWKSLQPRYERALAMFEQRRFADARQLLSELFAEFPDDEPTCKLLQRNATCLSQPPDPFDPVWNLDSK